MSRRIILFILALIVWVLLTGVFDYRELLVGVFVSALVAYLTGDMFVQRPQALVDPKRYLWFAVFIPVFLWEFAKANIDAAFRVCVPGLAINPGIVKVKTRLRSQTGIVFLANSVTLAPGTLSVDVDAQEGYLYIHWMDVKTTDVQKASEYIVKRFERILEKVFE